jgi:hypothetical protein
MKELSDRGDDGVDLGLGVARRHRQREDLVDRALGRRQRRDAEMLDGRLPVSGYGIVDAGRDAAMLQEVGELRAPWRADDEKVIDVRAARPLFGKLERQPGEPGAIPSGVTYSAPGATTEP